MDDILRNALAPGFVLQDYLIEGVLGYGGFGITYLAEDVHLNKKFAIKEFLPSELALRDGDSRVVPKSAGAEDDYLWGLEQFLQEAKTLARFEHPNIIQVLRFFEANGTAYIVMAFQEGSSLNELLERKKRLEEQELRDIVLPLIDGLKVIHREGVLHRDIKTENIFIRSDGTPILIDFGAARQALGDKGRSLTAIVSRGYAPFEQYTRRGKQGPWSDIYALAAVMYESVAGEPPPEAVDRVVEDDPMVPAVEAGKGRYSEAFLAGIDKALAPMARDRPQTLEEWQGMLQPEPAEPEPAAAEAAAPAVAAPPPEAPADRPEPAAAPAKGRRIPVKVNLPLAPRQWALAAAGLGVVVLGAVAWIVVASLSGGADEMAAAKPAATQPEPATQPEAAAKPDSATPPATAAKPETAPTPPPAKPPVKPAAKPTAKPEAPAQQATAPQAPPAKPAFHDGAALEAMFSQAQVYMKRKPGSGEEGGFGDHLWSFKPGGELSGEHYGLKGNEADSGRWSVEGDRLCTQWQTWEKGRKHCYRISGEGKEITATGSQGLLAGSLQILR